MVNSQFGKLGRLLQHQRAPLLLVLLAGLLGLATLANGFVLDDLLVLRGREGVLADALTLFDFIGGDPATLAEGRATGMFPWWTSENLQVRFLRPLAALTHIVDLRLWPNSPIFMHVQNLLWYMLLVGLVGALYRHIWRDSASELKWISSLALLLFTIDDAHALNIGWLSTRHSLIAGALSTGALLAHLRWRDLGWRAGGVVGPTLFTLGLCASEIALGVLGYLVAHAVVRERGVGWQAKAGPLVPYAIVVVTWFIVYRQLGAGAQGCGLYIDPFHEPLGFIAQSWISTTTLVGSQLGPPAVLELMVFVPGVLIPAAAITGAILIVGWWGLRRFLRTPTVKFWTLGMLLATLPHAATMPSDRYLLLIGIGGAGLTATIISAWIQGILKTRFARILAMVLVFFHLIVAIVLFVPRGVGITALHTTIERAATTLPDHPSLVLVNAPGDIFPLYAPEIRRQTGNKHPGVNVLYAGTGALEVTRFDHNILRLAPRQGYFAAPGEQVFADAFTKPSGTHFQLAGAMVEVENRDSRGAPTTILVHLGSDIKLMMWEGSGPVEFRLPPVGQSTTLGPVTWDFSSQ